MREKWKNEVYKYYFTATAQGNTPEMSRLRKIPIDLIPLPIARKQFSLCTEKNKIFKISQNIFLIGMGKG